MLTSERLEALRAVQAGTVKARHLNAGGSPVLFEPREMTVALGFLQKARLVEVHSHPKPNGLRGATVELT